MEERRKAATIAVAAVLVLGLCCHGARAEDEAPKGPPDATLTIDQYQVAFIGSGNLGGGTIKYAGKSHDFSIGGLGIGGIGVSKITAVGEVYGLKDLTHFPGAYAQARIGMVVADKGGGALWLKNAKGVYIKLSAKRAGIALSLGGDAVYIQMK